jgi:hypothetical protein
MDKRLPQDPQLPCLCGRPVNTGLVPMRGKFMPGELKISYRAQGTLSDAEIGYALALHLQGDWGNVSEEAWALNDDSLEHGGSRMLSRYRTHAGIEFCVLTESGQGTSLFLPGENDQCLPDKRHETSL